MSMEDSNSRQGVPRCPAPEDLKAFSLGALHFADIETIAAHLPSCADCETLLSQFDSQADALIDALRHEATGNTAQETDFETLIARVQEIYADPNLVVGANQNDTGNSPHERMPLRIGQYEILSRLGGGGMGVVYKARHAALGKFVALKVISNRRFDSRDAIRRFQREIKAVGKLQHPNIVAATDAGEADGRHYLTMELVEGIDLSSLLKKYGPPDIPDSCELVRQGALGLAHIHQHGLVHRDLKPSNLMLASNGQVKVLDLGLALLQADDRDESANPVTDRLALGTADYIAPEQINDAHLVDIRADIYSLGCTLYQLLTGRPPFDSPEYRSSMQKLVAHINHEAPSPTNARPDVSPPLAAIVRRMMAKDPRNRYESPHEVIEALTPHCTEANLLHLAKLGVAESTDSVSAAAISPTRSFNSRLNSESADEAGREKSSRQPLRWLGSALIATIAIWVILNIFDSNANVETPYGTLLLDIDQGDARVVIDGQQQKIVTQSGEQPIRIDIHPNANGTKQRHNLNVSKTGFQPFAKEFSLDDREQQRIQVRLQPVHTQSDTSPVAEENRPKPSLRDREAVNWVLEVGGTVNVRVVADRRTMSIKDATGLPTAPFTVYLVDLRRNAKMTDEGLRKLSGLEWLGIIYLDGATVSNAGLANLTGLPGLFSLNLANTPVSDEGVPYLQKLKGLKQLDLTNTQVSESGILQLKQELPNCLIKR